jgi:hypothetical protein
VTHHHHAGHVHPPVALAPSFLRMAVGARLAMVAVVLVLLWSAAFWAMT